jgi:hypothetical protein
MEAALFSIGYCLMALFTGWFISGLGDKHNWLRGNQDAATIFGAAAWPVAWSIMFTWLLSRLALRAVK